MNYFLKLLALLVLVIGVNMILLNVFHVRDYIAVSVSVLIAVLAATYEYRKSG